MALELSEPDGRQLGPVPDLELLEQLIRTCRQGGVRRMRWGEIELEFGEGATGVVRAVELAPALEGEAEETPEVDPVYAATPFRPARRTAP